VNAWRAYNSALEDNNALLGFELDEAKVPQRVVVFKAHRLVYHRLVFKAHRLVFKAHRLE